jgi:hypothetical protein
MRLNPVFVTPLGIAPDLLPPTRRLSLLSCTETSFLNVRSREAVSAFIFFGITRALVGV